MPDSCGTPTRRIKAHNLETGEDIEVIIVVGDERVEFNGAYSFDLAQLRRVIGAEVPAGLFHPSTGETDEAPTGDCIHCDRLDLPCDGTCKVDP